MLRLQHDYKNYAAPPPYKDVMVTPVITVHERDEFHIVWEKFESHGIRHFAGGQWTAGCVVGLISQRQLSRSIPPRHLEDGSWYYEKEMLDTFHPQKTSWTRIRICFIPKIPSRRPWSPWSNLNSACHSRSMIAIDCQSELSPGRHIIKFFLHHA